VADPQMPLLFGRGLGASPFRFRGSAFFDWVRTRDPGSRALSVSRKDRGAILPLGRARQNVFWYSLECNCLPVKVPGMGGIFASHRWPLATSTPS